MPRDKFTGITTHKKSVYETPMKTFGKPEENFASAFLPRDTVLTLEIERACSQIQNCFKIMAIVNHWAGYEKLKPVKVDDHEGDHAQKIGNVLNHLIDHTVDRMHDHDQTGDDLIRITLATEIAQAHQSSIPIAWAGLLETTHSLGKDKHSLPMARVIAKVVSTDKQENNLKIFDDNRKLANLEEAYDTFTTSFPQYKNKMAF